MGLWLVLLSAVLVAAVAGVIMLQGASADRPIDVLVYDDGFGIIGAEHIALLKSRGYVVEINDGSATTEQMEKASIVVGWTPGVQNAKVREALAEYVYGGGRLLLLVNTEYATCGSTEKPCWHDFTKDAFGFRFDGDVQHGVVRPAAGSEQHPAWNSPNTISELTDWCCDAYIEEIVDEQNIKTLATVSGQSYEHGVFSTVQDVPVIVVNDNPEWSGGMAVGAGLHIITGWNGPDMRMFENLIAFMASGVTAAASGDPIVAIPVAAITDGVDGFTELDGAHNVGIAQISGRTYAVVASVDDDGVQIIDISRTGSPIVILHPTSEGGFYTNLDAIIEVTDYQRTGYGDNSLIQMTARITNQEDLVVMEPNHQNNYRDGEVLVFLGGTMPPPSKGTEYRNSFGFGDKSHHWLRANGADVSGKDCTSEGGWSDIKPAETGVERLCFWVPHNFTPDGLFVAVYDVLDGEVTADLNNTIIRAQIIPFTVDSAYCSDHPDICNIGGLQVIDSDTYTDPHPPYVNYRPNP